MEKVDFGVLSQTEVAASLRTWDANLGTIIGFAVFGPLILAPAGG